MINNLTPIQTHGGFQVKRDDLFEIAGARGGKARTCWVLALGAKGLVTAGSRQSPQVNIVAHIAKRLRIPCRVHVPSGDLTPELIQAEAMGAEIIQHQAGYNNVIIARARADAANHRSQGWVEIPFGMECYEAVRQTAKQVENLPRKGRVVVPVGSGMSLAGILTGLNHFGRTNRVLGVMVGMDPSRHKGKISEYAPVFWRHRCSFVHSELDYHQSAPDNLLGNLILDPIYEAKCLPYLKKGDIFWCVGIRNTA